MSEPIPKVVDTPQSRFRFGMARADITPPVGIYHRMWGAATHDRSEGVHRPLLATACVFAPLDERNDDEGWLLVALDHCLLWNDTVEEIRAVIATATGWDGDRIVLTFSHTHGAGLMDPGRKDLPGGDRIAPYLSELADTLARLAVEAIRDLRVVDAVHGTGHCGLALHRDWFDTESGTWVCGYHPKRSDQMADGAVLATRLTLADGELRATVVNYGCHPTSLAWENRLISPDYPGAMRELVERETGAPCLFLLSPCGDVGPREGYAGDASVADANGRELGYAALSTLATLPRTGTRYVYRGPVLSGATLADWRHEPLPSEERAKFETFVRRRLVVPLPYRGDRPRLDDLIAERTARLTDEAAARERGDESGARDARALVERLTRAISRWKACPPGESFPCVVHLLRTGDAVWITLEGEPYQALQTGLRRRFPQSALIFAVIADGWRCAYLPTLEAYEHPGLYQVEVAMLAAGCLETLTEQVGEAIAEMLEG
jgi:hypothetical protein